MPRRICLSLSLLSLMLAGCGSPETQTTQKSGGQPTISLSPSSAVAGSFSFDLTITGENFAGEGLCAGCVNSVVVWTTDSGIDRLTTTFVSSTQLKAGVPGDLLATAATAKVTVETWAEGAASPRSVTQPALFSITALPVGAPAIATISPDNARAGSAALTITITGSNFDNNGFKDSSVVFWATNPNNLHDTGTMLSTTFVSSTQLTAVIPASLLVNPTSGQIVVLNGDSMGMSDGYFGYPESNSITFTVNP